MSQLCDVITRIIPIVAVTAIEAGGAAATEPSAEGDATTAEVATEEPSSEAAAPSQKDQPEASVELSTSPAKAEVGDAQVADTGPGPEATASTPADDLDKDKKDEKSEEIEELLVTGSRIPTALDKPATVTVFSSEDIDRTGLTSIGDILQQFTGSGGALNTRFNSSGNFGFPPDGGGIGAGSSQVDLRYMGSKRILVLVNGVRWVHGSSASGVPSATDLNSIPAGIIDRVEILQDGASAIYGSDAIGGVVNIITKSDFEGVSASSYLGAFHPGDGLTQQYSLAWGSVSDKLSTIASVSYSRQGEILATDRPISKYPTPGIGACTGSCSSGTPSGRFFFTDPNTDEGVDVTLNDTFTGRPTYDPNNPTGGIGDYHAFATADRFNYASYNLMLTPSERLGVFTQTRYEVTDHLNLHLTASYSHRVSKNQAAPEPIFIGPEAGNGNRLDTVSVDVTNPYNPFGFTLDAATNSYFIGRRPVENGPRVFRQNVNTLYLLGGLDGSFALGDFTFRWDTNVVYSINRADQIKDGGFNSAKLQKALGPLSVCEADPECVPFDIFGGAGTINQDMLDYVTFIQKDVSQQKLTDFTANVVSELFELPGGAVGIGVGFEHRRHQGFFRPDAVVVAGDTAGVPSSPTSGSFSANEVYSEIVLPILVDLPAVEMLDVTGAFRYSDYNTFGGETTYKAGLRWRPLEDLMLRGNLAQGFRAPGIGEAFGSEARFDQVLADPCSDYMGNTSGQAKPDDVVANCQTLGVPAGYEQFNSQISVTTGGNRDLQPESSTGITANIVYSPSWVGRTSWADSLSLELGYYRVELDKAIQAIDAQVQLDACVQTLDPALCEGINRSAGGTINGFANQLTNIGGITTDGIDVTIAYAFPKTSYGRFRLHLMTTYLLSFVEKIPASEGFDTVKRQGTEVGDPERAFPKVKGRALLGWSWDDWSASWTARYINSVTEECRGFEEFDGLCSNPNIINDDESTNRIATTVYNDLQATWTPSSLDRSFNVSVGVNNIFNQDPPACMSCALNGFDATTYDVPGIFGYLRAGVRL